MKVPINQLTEPASIIRPISRFEQLLMEDSLKDHGLLTPLIVCQDVIVDGYRRWLVARGLGWQEIDVHVVEGDPVQLRIICQTRQTDFGKPEKRILINQQLERDPDATAGQIAHLFKWSPIEVEQLCCVGYLVAPARELYKAGKISLRTAWQLGRLLDAAQLHLVDTVEPEHLHDEAEACLREVKHARRRSAGSIRRVKSVGAIEREIERPVYAGEHLIAADAQTPMDGWLAALRWTISGK